MSEFKEFDKVVYINEDSPSKGLIVTFERYYTQEHDFFWAREISSPCYTEHFRLATLLEIELQSE